MNELQTAIESLEADKNDLANKVTDFTDYGRYPSDENFQSMLELLNRWDKVRSNIQTLKGVKRDIENNLI